MHNSIVHYSMHSWDKAWGGYQIISSLGIVRSQTLVSRKDDSTGSLGTTTGIGSGRRRRAISNQQSATTRETSRSIQNERESMRRKMDSQIWRDTMVEGVRCSNTRCHNNLTPHSLTTQWDANITPKWWCLSHLRQDSRRYQVVYSLGWRLKEDDIRGHLRRLRATWEINS